MLLLVLVVLVVVVVVVLAVLVEASEIGGKAAERVRFLGPCWMGAVLAGAGGRRDELEQACRSGVRGESHGAVPTLRLRTPACCGHGVVATSVAAVVLVVVEEEAVVEAGGMGGAGDDLSPDSIC